MVTFLYNLYIIFGNNNLWSSLNQITSKTVLYKAVLYKTVLYNCNKKEVPVYRYCSEA